MKVNVKLIDSTLPLPAYQTEGAVAFDMYSRVDIEIEPKSTALIPLNLVIDIPKGYALILANRSSTGKKKGLRMVNGIGIIDQDYCGDTDEIRYLTFNSTDQVVKVEKGERIAQAMFVPIEKAELVEVQKMSGKDRGGFGTTGK